MLTFVATNYWIGGLALLFVLVCVLLMLIILIQRPRGGGLSGAFGGSSNAQAVFGSKTGDALTWLTVGFFASFIILAVVLTHLVKPEAVASPIDDKAVPAAPAKSSAKPLGGAAASTVPSLPAKAPTTDDAKAPAVDDTKAPATPAAEIPTTAPAPTSTPGATSGAASGGSDAEGAH